MSKGRCSNCGSAHVSVCDNCLTDTVERLIQQRSGEAHTKAFHAELARDQMQKERDEARAELGRLRALSSATPITECGFRPQTTNALWAKGFRVLGDVAKHTRAELLRMKNIGKVAVAEIEAALTKAGCDTTGTNTLTHCEHDGRAYPRPCAVCAVVGAEAERHKAHAEARYLREHMANAAGEAWADAEGHEIRSYLRSILRGPAVTEDANAKP